jgi:hypothetical protein
MYRVLLDENIPIKLKHRLKDVCDVYTVHDKKWNALENAELINAMQNDGFDYLITSDKNLQYQQNIDSYMVGIIVLHTIDNNYESFLPLIENIRGILINDNKTKLKIIS